jgi:hypothetical protein
MFLRMISDKGGLAPSGLTGGEVPQSGIVPNLGWKKCLFYAKFDLDRCFLRRLALCGDRSIKQSAFKISTERSIRASVKTRCSRDKLAAAKMGLAFATRAAGQSERNQQPKPLICPVR